MSGGSARRSSQILPTRPTCKPCGESATSSRCNMRGFHAALRVMIKHPLLTFSFGVLLALIIVIIVAGPMLDAPPNDVLLLVLFLASTGLLSILSSYTLYKLGLVNWFRSL